jgi:hypothetical protein
MRQALANDPELGALAKLPAYPDLMELLNDHASLSARLTVHLEVLRQNSPAFERAWDRVTDALKQGSALRKIKQKLSVQIVVSCTRLPQGGFSLGLACGHSVFTPLAPRVGALHGCDVCMKEGDRHLNKKLKTSQYRRGEKW